MRILLLHALPLDERMWAPQLDALADHDVVAPSLYALGGSSMDAWATALLREVPGDFLVMTGDRDPINAVDYARSLAAEAPDGEAVLFEQTGHLPSFEQPEAFDEKLRELVGRLA